MAETIIYNPLSGQFDAVGGGTGPDSYAGYSQICPAGYERNFYYKIGSVNFTDTVLVPGSHDSRSIRTTIKVVALNTNPYSEAHEYPVCYAELELHVNYIHYTVPTVVEIKVSNFSGFVATDFVAIQSTADKYTWTICAKIPYKGYRLFYSAISVKTEKCSFAILVNEEPIPVAQVEQDPTILHADPVAPVPVFGVLDLGNSGAAFAMKRYDAKINVLTLTADCVLTLPAVPAGASVSYMLKVIQDTTGGRNLTICQNNGNQAINLQEFDFSGGTAQQRCWVTVLHDGTDVCFTVSNYVD